MPAGTSLALCAVVSREAREVGGVPDRALTAAAQDAPNQAQAQVQRVPLLERLHTLLVAAAARLTAGYRADEYLELARLACELPLGHPDAPVAASVRGLLDRHAQYLATAPPRRGPRVPGIHMIFVAAAIARTPNLPVPGIAE